MTRVCKEGIYKHIEQQEIKWYLDNGWKNVDSQEPQPSQENLYVVDDYTIAKIKDI